MSVKETNRDLSLLNPDFKKKVDWFLSEAGDKIFVTEWYRTQERQNYLYSLWRTQPWQVVTWTRNSEHTKGRAIDIAFKWAELYPRDMYKWREIADIAEKYGIDWGEDLWGTDKPHFQDNLQPLQEMRQYYMDNYRKIPVENGDKMCKSWSNWCVFEWFEKIFITTKWLEQKEHEVEYTLEHEYNHIIFNRATKQERAVYEALYNISSPTDFITSYARTDYKEDFCEMWKIIFARKIQKVEVEMKWVLKLKADYNRHLYNKYS